MSLLSRIVDERFLAHRRRSTSMAGTVAGLVAVGLFAWRYYVGHVVRWDLLAVAITFVVVKLTVMIWSARQD